MAHKKAAGTTKNGRDSNPRYLGVKLTDGDTAMVGSIIVRQKGNEVIAGKNTSTGKDYTIFATKEGKVKFGSKKKMAFDSKVRVHKIVSVI
jgi:large subunit ribosomal protein L27